MMSVVLIPSRLDHYKGHGRQINNFFYRVEASYVVLHHLGVLAILSASTRRRTDVFVERAVDARGTGRVHDRARQDGAQHATAARAAALELREDLVG